MRWSMRREQRDPAAETQPAPRDSRTSATAPGVAEARSSEDVQSSEDSQTATARGGERAARRRRDAGESTGPAAGPRTGSRVGRRGRLAWRTRDAGAAAVGTLGSGVILLARLVMTAAAMIALLIALAIVLRDVDANQGNTIVKGVHEGANFFAGSFTGLIAFNGHPKRAITVDWGIALVAYLIVGAVIAGLITRVGRGGLRFERSHRVAPSP
jgi:hypothetical protein